MTPWVKAKASKPSNWILSQTLQYTLAKTLFMIDNSWLGMFWSQIQQNWNANTVTQTSFLSILPMFWKKKNKKNKESEQRGHRHSVNCCAPVVSSLDYHRSNRHAAGLCLKTSDTHQAINPPSVSLSHQAIQGCQFCPTMREILCNSWNLSKRAKSWQKNHTVCFAHDKQTHTQA